MAEILQGVFAALTTPFESGKIAIDHFRENIHKYNKSGLAGYVVAGSSGEAAYLTEDESLLLVEEALDARAPNKKIIVGTARESTAVTIAFTQRAADLGIQAALIRTPSYFKTAMTGDALKNHYHAIADKVPIPVIPYHIPMVTGLSIDPQLVIALSEHPNIIGIKDSSGNLPFLGELIPDLPSDFSYFLGAGSVFYFGLCLGASGGILRLADVIPDLCAALYEHFVAEEWEKAAAIQKAIIPLNNAIIQRYGIAGTKYAMDLSGFYGGPPRSPILPLDEAGKKEIEKILKKLDLVR
jgi:4-hydroxy-2-oxoglutarate aldolase